MPRRFIRHPASIPIQICSHSDVIEQRSQKVKTHDISAGGLSCETEQLMTPGEAVQVEISLEKPPFKTIGHVVWCQNHGERYLVGIGFADLATAYAVRMVEQVCYIEEYRQKVLQDEGRELSSEEAALEWILAHAEDFPQNAHE